MQKRKRKRKRKMKRKTIHRQTRRVTMSRWIRPTSWKAKDSSQPGPPEHSEQAGSGESELS